VSVVSYINFPHDSSVDTKLDIASKVWILPQMDHSTDAKLNIVAIPLFG
jgi:hypothetical protein